MNQITPLGPFQPYFSTIWRPLAASCLRGTTFSSAEVKHTKPQCTKHPVYAVCFPNDEIIDIKLLITSQKDKGNDAAIPKYRADIFRTPLNACSETLSKLHLVSGFITNLKSTWVY